MEPWQRVRKDMVIREHQAIGSDDKSIYSLVILANIIDKDGVLDTTPLVLHEEKNKGEIDDILCLIGGLYNGKVK